MNRHQRRAEAAETRRQGDKRDPLAAAMQALRNAPNTATGATVMMPDGQTIYVSRETAEAMRPPLDPPPSHGECLHAIHREAKGVMHLDIVLRADLPDLWEAVEMGNPEATALHERIIVALSGIINAPADSPKLCAVCPQPLGDGRFSLAIVTPACDDPRNGLALAVCQDCAETREAVRAKATQAVKRIWPDARPFTVTHPEGGRA